MREKYEWCKCKAVRSREEINRKRVLGSASQKQNKEMPITTMINNDKQL